MSLLKPLGLVRSQYYDLELLIVGHPDGEIDYEKLKLIVKISNVVRTKSNLLAI